MPRYAADSRDKVRDAVDMIDLVSTRTELKRAGATRYEGLCPFHEERTPSFGIDPEQKLFHCFGCGKGGDCFTFVQEAESLDFKSALEWLAARYGVELEVEDEDPQAAERRQRRERLLELLERTAAFYVRNLWESKEAAPARDYLRERGLDEATLREFRVGYAPSAWNTLLTAGRRQGFGNKEIFDAGLAVRAKGQGRVYDRFRRRIMFPLCDRRGRVLGFGARALGPDQTPKYLNSPEGELFHKGDQVYAADIARAHAAKSDQVVVCEGYTDVIALHQAGVRNAVGIMGTAVTDRQMAELARLAHSVLLALDADSAGQEAMVRAERLARGQRLELRVVPLPGGKDPADLVRENGADEARRLVESSVPFVSFAVDRALQNGDLSNAEGKDRVIADLRPAFAEIPPSALREELIQRVADATGLAQSLVSSWLPMPGDEAGAASRQQTSAAAPAAGREGAPHRGSGAPMSRAELAFLTACLADPESGARALDQIPDEEFVSERARRAASHLRGRLRNPGEGLPGDDEALARLIAALVDAAGRMQGSPEAVEGQLRELWIAREEQLVEQDRREGRTGIAERIGRISQWRRERDEFIDRTMAASRPADD